MKFSRALHDLGVAEQTPVCEVRVGPEMEGALRVHMDREDWVRSRCGVEWTPSNLVFTDEAGQGLRPEKIGRLFALLTRRAGLPRIRLHGLRHTSASLALERASR